MSKNRWYVLHAYSGYEKKVADSILEQANKLGISEHIEEVSVPTQHIVEVKRCENKFRKKNFSWIYSNKNES
jgi:transcriptional antiterminator NusG